MPFGAVTGAATLTSVPVNPVVPVVAEPVLGTAGPVVAELPAGADTGASTLTSDPGVLVLTELP
jgi:hypothetical protein